MAQPVVHDAWVEVDLAALRHNLRALRSALPNGVRLMAVVKSNGFGHGYAGPARAFVEAGADMLAVTRIDEAMAVREAGVTAPLLLFAPIQPANAEAAVEAELQLTVTTTTLAEALSSAARRLGGIARVHVKVDTGMGRLGISPGEALDFLKRTHCLPAVEVAGIYTHFSSAAEADLAASREQLRRFEAMLDELAASGIDRGLAHAANSAAILRLPQSHLDMVRPGTLLYGQYPSACVPHSLDLRPTWKLKARVCEVKEAPKGSPIGYGAEFTARRITQVAIVPIGYSDGFTLVPEGPVYRQGALRFTARKLRRSLQVEVNGRRAPVIGRVAMQMCAIDVTDAGPVRVGDEVTVPALRIPTSPLIPRVCTG